MLISLTATAAAAPVTTTTVTTTTATTTTTAAAATACVPLAACRSRFVAASLRADFLAHVQLILSPHSRRKPTLLVIGSEETPLHRH